MSEVTPILSAIEQGDPHALEQLLPLVNADLRQLAAHELAYEPPGQTPQPTALVHEAAVEGFTGGPDAPDDLFVVIIRRELHPRARDA